MIGYLHTTNEVERTNIITALRIFRIIKKYTYFRSIEEREVLPIPKFTKEGKLAGITLIYSIDDYKNVVDDDFKKYLKTIYSHINIHYTNCDTILHDMWVTNPIYVVTEKEIRKIKDDLCTLKEYFKE
jgi:hypothetical protein